jgi:uncharacterized protein HemX
MTSLFTSDIMVSIMAVLAAIAGALGLYARGQHYKIKNLKTEKEMAEKNVKVAEKKASINQAKANLHKEVAREIVKNNKLSKKKVEEIHAKIDEVKDGEEFTISI